MSASRATAGDVVQFVRSAAGPKQPIFMSRMSLRIVRLTGLLVILAAMPGWRANAQTLADAAKKASESSSAAKGTTRTFTDKDLPSSPAEDGVITPSGDVIIVPPGPVLSREE